MKRLTVWFGIAVVVMWFVMIAWIALTPGPAIPKPRTDGPVVVIDPLTLESEVPNVG